MYGNHPQEWKHATNCDYRDCSSTWSRSLGGAGGGGAGGALVGGAAPVSFALEPAALDKAPINYATKAGLKKYELATVKLNNEFNGKSTRMTLFKDDLQMQEPAQCRYYSHY